jgi:hypothetical protein
MCDPEIQPIPSGKLTWLLKIAIEIVDLPIKNGGSFHRFWYVYQRVNPHWPDPAHLKLFRRRTKFRAMDIMGLAGASSRISSWLSFGYVEFTWPQHLQICYIYATYDLCTLQNFGPSISKLYV